MHNPPTRRELRVDLLKIANDADIILMLGMTDGKMELVFSSDPDCDKDDRTYMFAIAKAVQSLIEDTSDLLNGGYVEAKE